jgi:hypothetical protein
MTGGGKHSIGRAAEGRLNVVRPKLACGPSRHWCQADTIAEPNGIDRAADLDHFTRTIGERNQRQMDVADATGHLTERDQEITVVQRGCVHSDANLLAAQGLQRTLERPKVFKAESINLRDEVRSVYKCVHLYLQRSECIQATDYTSSLRL